MAIPDAVGGAGNNALLAGIQFEVPGNQLDNNNNQAF
jgi:hypothetical protein